MSRAFVPARIAVLTVSDTRTPETDGSGAWLAGAIEEAGHVLAMRAIGPVVAGCANVGECSFHDSLGTRRRPVYLW